MDQVDQPPVEPILQPQGATNQQSSESINVVRINPIYFGAVGAVVGLIFSYILITLMPSDDRCGGSCFGLLFIGLPLITIAFSVVALIVIGVFLQIFEVQKSWSMAITSLMMGVALAFPSIILLAVMGHVTMSIIMPFVFTVGYGLIFYHIAKKES